jgi:hypothetical protein
MYVQTVGSVTTEAMAEVSNTPISSVAFLVGGNIICIWVYNRYVLELEISGLCTVLCVSGVKRHLVQELDRNTRLALCIGRDDFEEAHVI